MFKVVVYTHSADEYAEEVVKLIDSKTRIVEIHSRRDLKKINGKYYKDLSQIKQDLRQIVMLENVPELVLQKENVIAIPSFKGFDPEDRELQKIVEFFKRHAQQMSDLRHVIGIYPSSQ
jgi:TFIIF-interacting CTD phosphatase-like protein